MYDPLLRSPSTAPTRLLGVISLVLSPFVVWAVCVLLMADSMPRGRVVLASITLPVAVAAFIVTFVWSRKAAKPAPPVDDGWPKSHGR